MPNETDKNNEGGDGSGAGGDGANNAGAGEDTITVKKAEIDKLKEDSENYKSGMLKYKKDLDDLSQKNSNANQNQGQDGGNKSGQIDETKVGEVASSTVHKILREANEKTAQRSFKDRHPEYKDDAQWTGLLAELTFRGNELTSEEIGDRLESALLEHKRKTGKLEEYLKSEHEQGVREGRIQGEFGSVHGTGGSGDKNDSGKVSNLSPKGEEMARAMHVDPEKVKRVDISKDNVIKIV